MRFANEKGENIKKLQSKKNKKLKFQITKNDLRSHNKTLYHKHEKNLNLFTLES